MTDEQIERLIQAIEKIGFNEAVPTKAEPFGAIEGLTVRLVEQLERIETSLDRIAEALEE